MRDADLECFGSETSDLILKTTASKCLVCHTGDVVQSPDIKEDDIFMIYTRDGTLVAKHLEYRCNNRRLPCRAGH